MYESHIEYNLIKSFDFFHHRPPGVGLSRTFSKRVPIIGKERRRNRSQLSDIHIDEYRTENSGMLES